jgi:hypothetical protein
VGHEFGLRLGLIAFAATSARQALVLADFSTAVPASLLMLMSFYGVGCLAGEITRRIVEESLGPEEPLPGQPDAANVPGAASAA